MYKATFGAEFAEEIRKLDGRQLLVDLCGKCVEDSDEVDAYAAYEVGLDSTSLFSTVCCGYFKQNARLEYRSIKCLVEFRSAHVVRRSLEYQSVDYRLVKVVNSTVSMAVP